MDANTLINQAIAAGHNKDWPLAEQLYTQANQIDPVNGEATNGLGIALTHQDRFDEAAQWYDKTLELAAQKAGNVNEAAVTIARNGLEKIALKKKAVDDQAKEVTPAVSNPRRVNEASASVLSALGGGLAGGAAGAVASIIEDAARNTAKSAAKAGRYALIGGGIVAGLGAVIGWFSAHKHNKWSGHVAAKTLESQQAGRQ